MYSTIFNIIWVVFLWPIHLSMLSTTPPIFLFKSQTTFPHNHHQIMERDETGMNPVALIITNPWKEIDKVSDQTSYHLLSRPLHYWLLECCFTQLLTLFQSYHCNSSPICVFPVFHQNHDKTQGKFTWKIQWFQQDSNLEPPKSKVLDFTWATKDLTLWLRYKCDLSLDKGPYWKS